MKRSYSLVFLIIILFLFRANLGALEIESNSRYQLRGSLGSDLANLNHVLGLDYNFVKDDYLLSLEARLIKEYQMDYGRRYDRLALLVIDQEELALIPNYYFHLDSEDLRLLNYNLAFNWADNKVEYGNINPARLDFVPGGSLLGTYVDYADYDLKLWYGDSNASNNPFRGDSLGVKHEGEKRDLGYQLWLDESNQHFVSYQDSYQLYDDGLDLSSALGFDVEKSKFGLALGLDYSSRLGQLRYDLSTEYKMAEFEQLRGNGSGRREASMRLYQPINDFFASYRIAYNENNLSGQLAQTTQSLRNTVSLDYYSNQVYRFNFDYNLHFGNGQLEEISREFDLASNYQKLDYKVGVEIDGDYPVYDRASNDYLFFLESDYDFKLVQTSGAYELSKDFGQPFSHKFNLELDYERELSKNFDYDLGYNIRWLLGDRFEHSLKQNLAYNYDLADNKSFSSDLNSTYYLHRSSWQNSLTFRYNHSF